MLLIVKFLMQKS